MNREGTALDLSKTFYGWTWWRWAAELWMQLSLRQRSDSVFELESNQSDPPRESLDLDSTNLIAAWGCKQHSRMRSYARENAHGIRLENGSEFKIGSKELIVRLNRVFCSFLANGILGNWWSNEIVSTAMKTLLLNENVTVTINSWLLNTTS